MNIISEIKEADVIENGSKRTLNEYSFRRASRGVVFDEKNNIALIYMRKKNFYKLPGGGIEGEEDQKTALKREILEETGCTIRNIKELGVIIEYKNLLKKLRINYCYTARVLKKTGKTRLTIDEKESGLETIWISLDKAIKLLKNQKIISYNSRFVKKRCLTALETAKKMLNKK